MLGSAAAFVFPSCASSGARQDARSGSGCKQQYQGRSGSATDSCQATWQHSSIEHTVRCAVSCQQEAARLISVRHTRTTQAVRELNRWPASTCQPLSLPIHQVHVVVVVVVQNN